MHNNAHHDIVSQTHKRLVNVCMSEDALSLMLYGAHMQCCWVTIYKRFGSACDAVTDIVWSLLGQGWVYCCLAESHALDYRQCNEDELLGRNSLRVMSSVVYPWCWKMHGWAVTVYFLETSTRADEYISEGQPGQAALRVRGKVAPDVLCNLYMSSICMDTEWQRSLIQCAVHTLPCINCKDRCGTWLLWFMSNQVASETIILCEQWFVAGTIVHTVWLSFPFKGKPSKKVYTHSYSLVCKPAHAK